jgi:hypothetical protein
MAADSYDAIVVGGGHVVKINLALADRRKTARASHINPIRPPPARAHHDHGNFALVWRAFLPPRKKSPRSLSLARASRRRGLVDVPFPVNLDEGGQRVEGGVLIVGGAS